MLSVKFLPKRPPGTRYILPKNAPISCVTFLPKQAHPMLSVKFVPKKAPHVKH